jgi:hypothetical protein
MKYKIGEYYGNIYQEFNTEYIILSKTGISFNKEFKQIYKIDNGRERDVKSVELIRDVVLEVDGLFIKNEKFLEIDKLNVDEKAGTVDMIWDEEKSGVNPFEYDYFYVWYTSASHITSFSIKNNALNRGIEIRDNIINKILE